MVSAQLPKRCSTASAACSRALPIPPPQRPRVHDRLFEYCDIEGQVRQRAAPVALRLSIRRVLPHRGGRRGSGGGGSGAARHVRGGGVVAADAAESASAARRRREQGCGGARGRSGGCPSGRSGTCHRCSRVVLRMQGALRASEARRRLQQRRHPTSAWARWRRFWATGRMDRVRSLSDGASGLGLGGWASAGAWAGQAATPHALAR